MNSKLKNVLNGISAYISKKPIQAIIISGVAVRLFIVLFYSHVTIFPDSGGYIELSEFLLKLDLSGYDGMRSPGYPILLFLAGNILPIAVFFQMVIGLITSIYLFKTAKALDLRTDIAVVFTIVSNCILHVIFYETAILTETLTVFFITIIFYNLFNGFFTTATSLKQTLFLGFLLGFLTFIKPFYIFLPFLLYGLYTLKGFKISRIINDKIIIVFFPLIAFLGWSYVNKINTGYFVSTTIDGIYTAQNCVHFAEKTSEKHAVIGNIYAKYREQTIKNNQDVAMAIWRARYELMDTTKLSLVDLSHLLNDYNKVTIKMNPWGYTKQVFISWKDFWKTGIYWNYRDFNFPYINKAFLLVWFIQSFILQILKIVFIVLIPYHFIRFFKTRLITPELIIVTIVFCTSVLQARFSYPFEFLMIITLMLTFKEQLYKMIKIEREG